MALPRKVDFYRLPRAVQERFASATWGTVPPVPLLSRKAPRTAAWGLLSAAVLLTIGTTVLLRAGWGDVSSPLGLHGRKMLLADVGLLCGAAYGVLHAAVIRRTIERLPFRAGTHIFSACVVEAHGPVLRVWSVDQVEGIERLTAPSSAVALRMCDGSRVVVPIDSAVRTESVDAALERLRVEMTRTHNNEGPLGRAELDPLHDGALSSPIGPTQPMRLALPAWMRFDWALAASIGVALGLGLGLARNAASDAAMLRAMSASPTISMYRRYIEQGGERTAQVRDVLLPRAELRAAEAQGTVAAIQAFVRTHPGCGIEDEVDAAMRRALLSRLDEARSIGTITAITAFEEAYPQSHLDDQIQAARHALYARALTAWREKARPGAATAALIERLLAWSEESRDPIIELRFRPVPSTTLDDADRKAMKSAHFPGRDALPSQYVTSDAMKDREGRVSASLARAFAADFAPDMLSLRADDRLAPDAPVPNRVPTLVVSYSPEWARSITVSRRPSTVFVGLRFTFDVLLVVPKDAPLAIRVKALRGVELWKVRHTQGEPRQPYEQRVYDAMIDGAFDQLAKRLLDALL